MEFLLSLNFFFKLSISIYTGLNDLLVTLCTRKINTKYVWEPNLLSRFGETGNTTLGTHRTRFTIKAIWNAYCIKMHFNIWQRMMILVKYYSLSQDTVFVTFWLILIRKYIHVKKVQFKSMEGKKLRFINWHFIYFI